MVRRRKVFPDWLDWELLIWLHAEKRMTRRGVTEVDVRAMLERPLDFEPSYDEGRFLVHTRHGGRPWVVVVEPAPNARVLQVVSVFQVES